MLSVQIEGTVVEGQGGGVAGGAVWGSDSVCVPHPCSDPEEGEQAGLERACPAVLQGLVSHSAPLSPRTHSSGEERLGLFQHLVRQGETAIHKWIVIFSRSNKNE